MEYPEAKETAQSVRMLICGLAPFVMDFIPGSSFYDLALKLIKTDRLDSYFQRMFRHPRRVRGGLILVINGKTIHTSKDWRDVELPAGLQAICAAPSSINNHCLSKEEMGYLSDQLIDRD